MPTPLPQLRLSRLTKLRRLPFWAQALALCALFAIVGVAVLDDYGVGWDGLPQRRIVNANADYIITGNTDGLYGLYHRDFRYYGVAFETPLLLAERALGLQDTRHIYLTRHLLTHLFFIAGGFACGLLAYRTLGSRWVALFAMLLFLLHPRLYVHSFVNTKDIPLAAMLAIALYLAHRAFRKDTLGAFLICGIATGLAINLRVFGLMLLPMILAMRAPDLWRAGSAERKHILITGAAFLAAALATAYIVHPYYWENPLRLIEGVRVLSQHPTIIQNLFMGEIYRSDAVPWNYIPVWFAITAPPAALLLGSIGVVAVCWQAITRPLRALLDRETRFRVMLLGCFVMPVVVIIALQSNIYDGWRHMYFLWVPFCLLAAVGLRAIANISVWGGIWNIGARPSGRIGGGGLLHMAPRALAYGIAGAGLITTLTAMAALHPHQQVYFNALVDAKTPGALGKRYAMDYYKVAHRQSLEYLLARYPHDTLRVRLGEDHRVLQILPQADRDRLIDLENPHAADFYLLGDRRGRGLFRKPEIVERYYLHPLIDLSRNISDQPPLHSTLAYGSVLRHIVAKNVEPYRAAYADVEANGTSLARSDFDIYAYDGALYYLSADCPPPAPNRASFQIFLHITPADLADLPAASREFGFENRDFRLDSRAAFFDGKCIHRQPLPDYQIERIATGVYKKGELIWRADINLAARAAASVVYESIAAGDYGAPVAQLDFDVYLRGNALTYLKEPCAPADVDARFFLHIFPADSADLPAGWREYGFENMDFQFADHGADIGDKCVAKRDLPDYAIKRIRTGQFVSGEGALWRADVELGE